MAQAYQDTNFAYQGAGELVYQYNAQAGESIYGVTAGTGLSVNTGEVEVNAQGVGGNKTAGGTKLDGVEGIVAN